MQSAGGRLGCYSGTTKTTFWWQYYRILATPSTVAEDTVNVKSFAAVIVRMTSCASFCDIAN